MSSPLRSAVDVRRMLSFRNQSAWPDCSIGKSLQDGTVEGGEPAGLAASEFDKERTVNGDAGRDGAEERTLEQGSGWHRLDAQSARQVQPAPTFGPAERARCGRVVYSAPPSSGSCRNAFGTKANLVVVSCRSASG